MTEKSDIHKFNFQFCGMRFWVANLDWNANGDVLLYARLNGSGSTFKGFKMLFFETL